MMMFTLAFREDYFSECIGDVVERKGFADILYGYW
jgi:hypothetical protein